jgi:hypothetical protein
MNTKEPEGCNVTEYRFRDVLKYLRMDNASITYSIYVYMVVYAYSLCLAFYMNIITHNDDLIFMRNFQALNSTSVLIGCSQFKVGEMLECSSDPIHYLTQGKTFSG